eukprot:2551250-Rhodomonas_salina.1
MLQTLTVCIVAHVVASVSARAVGALAAAPRENRFKPLVLERPRVEGLAVVAALQGIDDAAEIPAALNRRQASGREFRAER